MGEETLDETMARNGIPREAYTTEVVQDPRRIGRPKGRYAALARAALITDPEARKRAEDEAGALPVVTAWTPARRAMLGYEAHVKSMEAQSTRLWAEAEMVKAEVEYREAAKEFGPGCAGAMFAFQVLKIWIKQVDRARKAEGFAAVRVEATHEERAEFARLRIAAREADAKAKATIADEEGPIGL